MAADIYAVVIHRILSAPIREPFGGAIVTAVNVSSSSGYSGNHEAIIVQTISCAPIGLTGSMSSASHSK
jgi:hypothetical protein